MPPQQIDLDDGVYLPMDMFREEPIYSKEVFFQIVDSALLALAGNQGWKFIKKDTCARIEISQYAHLDFPLYAMPRDRFEKIKSLDHLVLDTASNSYQFTEAASVELDPSDVHLARRDKKHWVKSDPKQIEDWFIKEKELHGRRLTRVCRYFKAWRDFTWRDGAGPASIVLMACVTKVFDQSEDRFERDCEAILAVSKKLSSLLNNEIENPALSSSQDREIIFPRGHSQIEIDEIVDEAKAFHKDMNYALVEASSSQEVVDRFINCFGDRVPNKKDLVYPAPTIATILNIPPKKQPRPNIPNTKSA